MPAPRRPMPVALKAFAVALGVLALVGVALAVGGAANRSLVDLIRGASLAVVALGCLVGVLVRGRRVRR